MAKITLQTHTNKLIYYIKSIQQCRLIVVVVVVVLVLVDKLV